MSKCQKGLLVLKFRYRKLLEETGYKIYKLSWECLSRSKKENKPQERKPKKAKNEHFVVPILLQWKWKVKVTQPCPTLCDPMDSTVHGNLQARILEWGRLSLLQGIFQLRDQTQISCIAGANPDLPHCGRILYQLNHKGSPRILEWVAYPFSSGSSQPRNWTGISRIGGRFFTNWAIREANVTIALVN